MKKTFKKIAASVMSAATLIVGTVGMTVSAYSPTITRNFTVGNSTATATSYRCSTFASSSTSLSGGRCSITLTYAGKTDSRSNYVNSVSVKIEGSGSSANSTHSANKGGYSNSTNISC